MLERKYPKTKRRRSIRISEFDYAQEGSYFITVCTHQWKCTFGKLKDGVVHLSPLGEMVQRSWDAIPRHFPHVTTDSFVIMPNHIHGIISIDQTTKKKTLTHGTSGSVGSVVRCLKVCVTKWAHKHTHMTDIWQRNYYEHVIRDERDYLRLAEYIENNPLRWGNDALYKHD